jgi:hypothetical protein
LRKTAILKFDRRDKPFRKLLGAPDQDLKNRNALGKVA